MKSSDETDFLNYHHLRYFWTVAREGSLRRASEVLRVSQPSMCTQIKLLEANLGEALFRPSGRSLALTEFGQMVFGYAEEIFALGGEILRATQQAPGARALKLNVGIVDSFPKLMSCEILRPVFERQPPVKLTCHEGKLPDLAAQLSTHRLDVVLSDEPASPGVAGKVFNHLLGSSDVTFCAMPGFARRLTGRFPRNLHQLPALLPTQNCALRRDLEKWFRSHGIEPRVVAEFEDAALTKIVATGGQGYIVVPSVIVAEVAETYGFVALGRVKAVETAFYAITAERRFTHPAVIAMTNFRNAGKPRSSRRLSATRKPQEPA